MMVAPYPFYKKKKKQNGCRVASCWAKPIKAAISRNIPNKEGRLAHIGHSSEHTRSGPNSAGSLSSSRGCTVRQSRPTPPPSHFAFHQTKLLFTSVISLATKQIDVQGRFPRPNPIEKCDTFEWDSAGRVQNEFEWRKQEYRLLTCIMEGENSAARACMMSDTKSCLGKSPLESYSAKSSDIAHCARR